MSQSAIIVLAGGQGLRFGGDTPKQLAMLAGKPVLEHTLSNIAGCEELKQIIVVSHESVLLETRQIADRVAGDRIKVVQGGGNRLLSTKAGIEAVEGDKATKVLVHDGVRPFISHKIIRDCLSGLDTYDAVDVVINSADTLVQIGEDPETIGQIPNRANFRRGQTPQGFWLGKFQEVLNDVGDLEQALFTDDCGMYLFARPNARIGLIAGSEANIKVTHPIDLFIAQQLIMSGQAGNDTLVEAIDLADKNVVIFGSSSGLGKDAFDTLTSIGVNAIPASRSSGCDITDPSQIERVLKCAEDEFGQIDAVVNFSGILQISRLVDATQCDIEQVVAVNYLGALNVARIAQPFLKKAKGQLILVASSSYYRGRSNYSVYSSSKAAVVNMAQALSEEWMDEDIRVNCIVPRRANTPMRWAAFPDEDPGTLLEPKKVSHELVKMLKSYDTGAIKHVN